MTSLTDSETSYFFFIVSLIYFKTDRFEGAGRGGNCGEKSLMTIVIIGHGSQEHEWYCHDLGGHGFEPQSGRT